MPDNVKQDFLEAREIFAASPRGACGLLRVAAEKLCADILGKDKSFNGAIGEIVSRGVSAEVQRSLDVVRLHGNDALHPGQLSDSDTRERALFMFTLLNVLVDEKIGLNKRLDDAYTALPETLKEQIQRRDGKVVKPEASAGA